MTYTIKQGDHFSFPRLNKIAWNTEKVKWEIFFHQNCNYHIKNPAGSTSVDQKDWNKLCGLFFSMFSTRQHTAMVAWRYNLETDLIELAPYYHVDGSRDMFPPLFFVQRNEKFSVTLTVDREVGRYTWLFEKADASESHQMAFSHQNKFTGFINFYFGGNETAPQEVACDLEIV